MSLRPQRGPTRVPRRALALGLALVAAALALPAAASARSQDAVALTVAVTGAGAVAGPGIACLAGGGGDCVGTYPAGTVVTLTETPDPGAEFLGWGGFGGCSGTAATCTITMDVSSALTADFTAGGSNATLTVSAIGGGTVSGPGIDCGAGAADCTESYTAGTEVTLTESPAPGLAFSGWGGACSGSAATCTVTVEGAAAVSGTFSGASANVTLTVDVSGAGTVTGPGIDCGGSGTDCTETYASGTALSLVATLAPGSTFTAWGGACSGAATACTVSMTASQTVAAAFGAPATRPLTVAVDGPGHVTGDGIDCGSGAIHCAASYPATASVTLTASPAAGARFAGWAGSCSGTAPSCTLQMAAGRSATASFSRTYAPLTVTTTGPGRVTGPGIACGAGLRRCSRSIPAGAAVTLTAAPRPGASFAGWGGACAGRSSTCTVPVDRAQAVSAAFAGPSPAVDVPFAVRQLGAARVVRRSTGWDVSLRFSTSRTASALLRLSLNGRATGAFTFSLHPGPALVGPFRLVSPGRYRFQLTLTDSRGAPAGLTWNLCLGRSCRPLAATATPFLRNLGVAVSRTATGWRVRVRFRAAGSGAASITMVQAGREVSGTTFRFHQGVVVVDLPTPARGDHRVFLAARDAAGRVFRLQWNVPIT